MGSRIGATQGTDGRQVETEVDELDGLSVQVDGDALSANWRAEHGGLRGTVQARGLSSEATTLDGTLQLALPHASLHLGARESIGGTLSGTTLLKLGYDAEPDRIGPFLGDYGADVGAAFLPDLRGRLIPGPRDALGEPVGRDDASISAAVLAAQGSLELPPIRTLPGVTVDAGVRASAVAVAPIESQPGVKTLIKRGNNGAVPFDVGTAAGLSRFALAAHAGVSLKTGPLRARVEATARSNVMDDPTFALASGGPAGLLSRYAFTEATVDAALSVAGLPAELSAHAPLRTTSGELPSVSVQAKLDDLIARATLELGPTPVLDAEASLPLGHGFNVSAHAGTNFRGDTRAGLTLSFAPAGRPPLRRTADPAPGVGQPVPSASFSALPAGLANMDFAQTVAALDTPQKVAAYLNTSNTRAGALAYLPHNDDWSKWTPRQTFANRGGICADLHLFGASVLAAHGYEAVDVQLMARTLAHDVIAYRERDGRWEVMQYGRIFRTDAGSAREAVLKVFPDAMQLQEVDPKSLETLRAGKTPWAESVTDWFERP